MAAVPSARIALIEAGSPGLNIYSHVAWASIALLATVVRDAGYDSRAFIEDISARAPSTGPGCEADVIGFSAITCTMPRTRELIARARAEKPAATILLGARTDVQSPAELRGGPTRPEGERSSPARCSRRWSHGHEGLLASPVWSGAMRVSCARAAPGNSAPRSSTRCARGSRLFTKREGSVASVWRAAAARALRLLRSV